MEIKPGKKMLWLTSWPNGKLKQVEIIDRNTNMGRGNYWYIRKNDGSSNTTTDSFLFDYPDTFYPGPDEEPG